MIALKGFVAVSCAYVACACTACIAGTPANERDHLVSFNFEGELDYRPVLLDKLIATNQDYGRFLVLPAFKGEVAVAVHTGVGRDLENTFVTYTEADRSLYNALKYPKPDNKEIKITRIDAPIAKSAAQAIAAAWKRMLYRTQAPELGGAFANDATMVEVSLVDKNGEALYGRLPLERGKHTEALYQVGIKLIAYCKADPAKRPAIAQEIERDANALVIDLSKTPFCRP